MLIRTTRRINRNLPETSMAENECKIKDAVENDAENRKNSEQAEKETTLTGKSETHERKNDQRLEEEEEYAIERIFLLQSQY